MHEVIPVLKKYIKEVAGTEVNITDVPETTLRKLPVFMVHSYSYMTCNLFGRHIVLMIRNGENEPADQIRKHLELAGNKFNALMVAVLGPIESYNRLRLIEKRIPFIIPGKQMFLPELFIDFNEMGKNEIEIPQIMQPSTQFLLLYHLQVQSLEGMNLKSIADQLDFMPMTITRAAYYLHNSGLARLEGTKEKFLSFNKSNLELWNVAEPLMTNPIKKTHYLTGYVSDSGTYISNINALSHYTDLSDDVINHYAVKQGYLKQLVGANLKEFSKIEANIYIEEWKYNPYLLTKNTKYVDKLSLYLCLKEANDDRTKMALQQLINSIEW